MDKQIVVIAHNIRSSFNVGSLIRTCDGLGVQKIFFSGYTPYPQMDNDNRLPHISAKLTKQIHKTALGAEMSLPGEHRESVKEVIHSLKNEDFVIVGLEQSSKSTALPDFVSPEKVALLIGEEVNGIAPTLQIMCDYLVEIPMFGEKESFNVTIASAMALYHFRFS